MANILKLKKNKDKVQDIIKTQTEEFDSKRSYEDDRYWKPVIGKDGNGSAVIRFLPGIEIEGSDDFEPPFVRKWSHGFKGPGGWYIENSRNTLTGGENAGEGRDPVTEYNSKLWKTEDKGLRIQAQKQKRKLSYISNVYVVRHPARPDDEGKVFLYRYGKKIYDKIKNKAFPSEEDLSNDPDLQPLKVFDLWEGANFRLKIKTVKDFPNYDDSEFDVPKPLSKDDSELEKIYNQEHSLLAEVAPDKFKTYNDLKKRLYEVLDLDPEDELPMQSQNEDEVDEEEEQSSKLAVTKTTTKSDDDTPFDLDEEEDTKPSSPSNFFKKLKENKNR